KFRAGQAVMIAAARKVNGAAADVSDGALREAAIPCPGKLDGAGHRRRGLPLELVAAVLFGQPEFGVREGQPAKSEVLDRAIFFWPAIQTKELVERRRNGIHIQD